MKKEDFISTTELADILRISRVTVFNKIKSGEIKAIKVGRNFIIDKKELGGILGKELNPEKKEKIEKAVKKIVEEYSETLRLLEAT